jgi:hypothetical protein
MAIDHNRLKPGQTAEKALQEEVNKLGDVLEPFTQFWVVFGSVFQQFNDEVEAQAADDWLSKLLEEKGFSFDVHLAIGGVVTEPPQRES